MIQVVRYSALTFGVLYGIVHRRTLQSQFDSNAAHKEVELRQHWLEQAKEAWAKKQANSNGRKFFILSLSLFPPFRTALQLPGCDSIRTSPGEARKAGSLRLTENVTDHVFPFPPPFPPLPSFLPSHVPCTVVTDPDAPGFDLEKLLQSFEK